MFEGIILTQSRARDSTDHGDGIDDGDGSIPNPVHDRNRGGGNTLGGAAGVADQ